MTRSICGHGDTKLDVGRCYQPGTHDVPGELLDERHCEATMPYEGGAKNSNAMLSGSRQDSPEP
jgi:hypothetical protein